MAGAAIVFPFKNSFAKTTMRKTYAAIRTIDQNVQSRKHRTVGQFSCTRENDAMPTDEEIVEDLGARVTDELQARVKRVCSCLVCRAFAKTP